MTEGGTGVLLLSVEGTVLAHHGPAAMFGPPRHAVGYADLPAFFRAESGDDLLALVREAADPSGSGPFTVRVVAERGDAREPLLLTLHPVAAGLVVGVLSDRKNGSARPDHALTALRMVWDGLVEGVAVATRDPHGRMDTITAANLAFPALFGLEIDEVIGRPLGRFLAPVNGGVFARRVDEEVVSEGRSIMDLTMARAADSGDRRLLDWELAPVRAEDGRVAGVIAIVRDTWHAPRAPSRERSDFDPSSGLPNQVHFLRRLERSVERAAQARPYSFAVVGLEMRGLRAVERRMGTLMANTALEALVRRLEQRLRPTDVVARIGDRRLAILLEHFAPWGAVESVLERIRLVTDEPYTIAGERMTMSAVGAPVPVWSGDGPPEGAHDVLRELDAAVDRAQAEPAEPRPSAPAPRQIAELVSAVQKAQLRLCYLPLISLRDGSLAGLEALVRWSRPDHGIVPGRAFLRDAEHHGLMAAIGEWVWWEALRAIREWDATLAPGRVPPVHLNLSVTEFWQARLVGDLERRTAEAMVAPSRIRLEVPESAVARRTSSAQRILESMAGAGFVPWLDRFGEGGTRLRDLESMPFRHVKLPTSIAWRSNGHPGPPRATLASVLALGRDLGWTMAVGGVESREQAETLRALGCDLAQGYFYHGTLDPTQAAALMRRPTDGGGGPTDE
ncbi:MAG: EAL domain-containing protein [Gemmatimonadales bacterium]